ncbi:hypothetical protein [Salibacterium lacus]|uniref:Uncharacterized protein n=1 Tax=Salibacterium lacus TaxID=1898109 RepID=A0ABW5SY54_9BACI
MDASELFYSIIVGAGLAIFHGLFWLIVTTKFPRFHQAIRDFFGLKSPDGLLKEIMRMDGVSDTKKKG